MEEYTALQPPAFVAKNPRDFALEFGDDDPIKEMISLASINAIFVSMLFGRPISRLILLPILWG
jgi:hypothetical protein